MRITRRPTILISTALICLAACPAALGSALAPGTDLGTPDAVAPNRVIVKLTAEAFASPDYRADLGSAGRTGLAALDGRLAALGADNVTPLFMPGPDPIARNAAGLDRILLVHFDSGLAPEQAAQNLAGLPETEYAEPDRQHRIMLVPDDTLYPLQWAHDNTGQAIPWGGGNVGTPDCDTDTDLAWDLQTGSSSLIISVIDTGCDLTHPEYSAKLVPGYDFINNDNDPSDDHGHGTKCAGVALGQGNNTQGIAGVAWGCLLMPIKVLDSGGYGYVSGIADGMVWAADHGARILSMSLGGGGSSTYEDALDYVHDVMGCVVFCAAGNGNDPYLLYPAGYARTIAVGSISPCNERKSKDPTSCDNEYWWGSNYGDGLDFLAPGVRIHTTAMGGHYVSTFNGTSSATPHAAGIGALVWSEDPALTNVELRALLQATCDDIYDPGWDSETGYGRLNAHEAVLRAAGDGFVRGDSDASGEVNISDPVYNLAYQFADGAPPICMDAADVDDSGEINISDPIHSLNFQFGGGTIIPLPYPNCGFDPTTSDPYSCSSFPPCEPTLHGGLPADNLVESQGGTRLTLGQPPENGQGLISVPLKLQTDLDLYGFEFTISYDPSVLRFVGLEAAAENHPDYLSASEETVKGRIHVGCVHDMSLQSPLSSGHHSIGHLQFQIPGSEGVDTSLLVEGLLVTSDMTTIRLRGEDMRVSAVGAGDDEGLSCGALTPRLSVPNPYWVNTVMRLETQGVQSVEASVYNVHGQRIATLLKEVLAAGGHELVWDGRSASDGIAGTGIYYLRVTVGQERLTHKLLVIK